VTKFDSKSCDLFCPGSIGCAILSVFARAKSVQSVATVFARGQKGPNLGRDPYSPGKNGRDRFCPGKNGRSVVNDRFCPGKIGRDRFCPALKWQRPFLPGQKRSRPILPVKNDRFCPGKKGRDPFCPRPFVPVTESLFFRQKQKTQKVTVTWP